MIVDFGIVKRLLMEEVHDRWDHAFIAWAQDTEVIDAFAGHGWKFETMEAPPTAEHLAELIFVRISGRLPEGLRLMGVEVRETPSSTGMFSA